MLPMGVSQYRCAGERSLSSDDVFDGNLEAFGKYWSCYN